MLAPWKKSYDKPRQHIKSRDITLLTKIHLVKAMVFPVVMYGCESWTIKKADRQRIDAFELWCWRRLKNWLIGKDPDAGKDWRQEEKGMTEDETVGWYQRLDGHSLSKLLELVMDREAWHVEVHGVTKNQTQLSEWTELNWSSLSLIHLELSSWPLLSLLDYVERVWLLPLSFNYWTVWLVDKLRDKFRIEPSLVLSRLFSFAIVQWRIKLPWWLRW